MLYMLKIYHNPRCRKSRTGLDYLRSRTADFEIINYIRDGLNEAQLKEILLKMNNNPQDLVRTQEDLYKKELKGRTFNQDEWIRIITDNPRLLQRPIVVSEHKAVLAQPPEIVDILL